MQNTKNTPTPAQTMAELTAMLGLTGATKIQFNFKPNKVTASCRCNGRSYGSRGNSFNDAIAELMVRITGGTFYQNQF